MAIDPGESATSDAAILSRLLRVQDDALTADAAEALLRIQFKSRDLNRIHELLERNRDDALSPAERLEMQSYRRVSFLLDLMHSRARRALKKPQAVP